MISPAKPLPTGQAGKDSFKHSNLIEMLKTFSKEELKEFGKFVRSPFFNNRNEVTYLFNEVKKYHPAFDRRDFTKENIFSKVHPEAKYKDNVMRRMTSNLKTLIENYLSYKYFSDDAFEKKFSFLKSLYERKHDKLINKEFNRAEGTLLSKEGLDELYLLDNYRLNALKYNFYLSRGEMESANNIIKELGNSLIYFFLYELFAFLNDCYGAELDFNVKSESGLLSSFMNSFNAAQAFDGIKDIQDDRKILILATYYSYLAVRDYEHEEPALKLEELLKKNPDKFKKEMTKDLYRRLLNNYAHKSRKGNFKYYRKGFEIFNELINKNLLINEGAVYLDESDLLNIIHIANRLKEFDWAESFVEKNIDKTNPDEKNDLYYYSKALIAHSRKELDTALDFIMKVNLDSAKYTVNKYMIKNLVCKIYYDMDYTEQLFSFIDSFRHYLNNDKLVPKDIKANFLSFLLYFNKIVKIKSKEDYDALPVLRKNILESKCLLKEWLLEKIEELKGKLRN